MPSAEQPANNLFDTPDRTYIQIVSIYFNRLILKTKHSTNDILDARQGSHNRIHLNNFDRRNRYRKQELLSDDGDLKEDSSEKSLNCS